MASEVIKLGIVGACGRGASFKSACDALLQVRIEAVCDTNEKDLGEAANRLGASQQYTSYDQMLDEAGLDAVIIGTPMPLHVPQAIAALQRGMHVLSEVPAGISIDECRDLTIACRKSEGIYMMAENYTYIRSNVLVRELVKRGLFGTTYYGEGEYIHELKGLNEITKWRRKWQTGINGNTYPTHSLGPILQWMPGDRVTSVCHGGSGHHYKDPRGEQYEQEDSVVSLCRMASGGLVKLRIDMLSDRPHAMTNYQLQGTDGCYESARAHGEQNRVWLRSLSKDPNHWMRLEDLEDQFLPDDWKHASEIAKKAGHGGGDHFEVIDFINAITGKCPPTIGIDAAMDMTLPGLASQQSAAMGGRWVDVPNSRQWTADFTPWRPQLRMLFDTSKPSPDARVPADYRLRQLGTGDFEKYRKLMDGAGFEGWVDGRIQQALMRSLPNTYFVIEHIPTGELVASAFSYHNPSEELPNAASLEYVAGDARHKGKGLGYAVCAAVTRTLLERGYRKIFLTTDDWRLPAIAVYLKLGYTPDLYLPQMSERWAKVNAALSPAMAGAR
jgi:predicted dehydrogenase/GNAT superfamily N-acetyltransferase